MRLESGCGRRDSLVEYVTNNSALAVPCYLSRWRATTEMARSRTGSSLGNSNRQPQQVFAPAGATLVPAESSASEVTGATAGVPEAAGVVTDASAGAGASAGVPGSTPGPSCLVSESRFSLSLRLRRAFNLANLSPEWPRRTGRRHDPERARHRAGGRCRRLPGRGRGARAPPGRRGPERLHNVGQPRL